MSEFLTKLFINEQLDLQSFESIDNLYAAYCVFLEERENPPDPYSLMSFLIYFARKYDAREHNFYLGLMALVRKIARKQTGESNIRPSLTHSDVQALGNLFGNFIYELQISGTYLPELESLNTEHPHAPSVSREFQYIDMNRTLSVRDLLTLLDDIVLDQRFLDTDALERYLYKLK